LVVCFCWQLEKLEKRGQDECNPSSRAAFQQAHDSWLAKRLRGQVAECRWRTYLATLPHIHTSTAACMIFGVGGIRAFRVHPTDTLGGLPAQTKLELSWRETVPHTQGVLQILDFEHIILGPLLVPLWILGDVERRCCCYRLVICCRECPWPAPVPNWCNCCRFDVQTCWAVTIGRC